MPNNNAIEIATKKAEGFNNSADGLWDIALGLTILIATISIFFNLVMYTAISYFLIFLLVLFLKKTLHLSKNRLRNV